MKVQTTARLGAKRELTPEGFLLCRDVAIARTGVLYYGAGEVPVEPGRDGVIRITRSPDEVFHPEAIASFHGKPVTKGHPPEDVTPANWKEHSVGIILDPRQGVGIEDDFVFADLLIQDKDTVDELGPDATDLPEVSCGYDAEYFQVQPGQGYQQNIRGNHLALVPKGRCGPRCAIGDAAPIPTGDQDMKTRDHAAKPAKGVVQAALDAVAKGLGFKDAADMMGAAEDEESEEAKAARIAAEAKEKGGKTGDAATFDAEALGTSLATAILAGLKPTLDTIAANTARPAVATADQISAATTALTTFTADAEILAPGYQRPTHDAATATPAATADHLCACQRAVLATAFATEDGRKAVEPFLAGKAADFATMDAATVSSVFTGAAHVMRALNNGKTAGGLTRFRVGDHGSKVKDAASINKANDDFWAARRPAHVN